MHIYESNQREQYIFHLLSLFSSFILILSGILLRIYYSFFVKEKPLVNPITIIRRNLFPQRKNKLILIGLIFSVCLCYIPLFSQEKDTLKAEDILKMSFEDLMNVEVTSASKVQQLIKEVAASVQIVTAEQIKNRGYFTLEEALSDLPGFQFRNIVGFNSYIFMRGAPNQNNLILLLVDGIQINELNSGGFYGGGQFNLSNVEQIEVVYGPASALYGTNAISGVINIITKNPDEKNKGHISVLGGNYKTGMIDFNYNNTMNDKDLGLSISGMYKTSEKADLAGSAGDDNWTNDMENYENDVSLSFKLKYKNYESGIEYQQKKSSNTTYYKSVGDIYSDKNSLWNIFFLNGFLKYTNEISGNLKLNSMIYYRNATVSPNTIDHVIKSTADNPGEQVGYFRPNQLIGMENQCTYKLNEKLMIVGGIVGELEQLSNGFSITQSASQYVTPPEPGKPKMLNNRLFSYFFQLTYKIFDQVSFIGGLRHDFSNYYDEVITPRAGIVFNAGKISLKALYNTAFRAPKPWDYNYGLGNPDLKPEKMRSAELNLSYLAMNNLFFGSSIYKNLIKDKLTKEYVLNGDRWINKDKLNTLGFELYGNYSINDFLFNLNYSYNDSYDQNEADIPEISKQTANAGITYSYDSNLKINLRTNYIGERKNPAIIPATGTNLIDPSFLFHTCISYLDYHSFDFQLKISNILDKKYYHPNNRFAGRYRQPERTFTFKVIYYY
jgi:outer membrane receptor for ferrienterochelin and colicins